MRQNKIIYIDPIEIDEGDRARKEYKLKEDFLRNVTDHGILQPIVIDQNNKLVAGGRRLRAAQMVELEEIPCVVREIDDPLAALEIELFENIHREDMEWHEELALTLRIHREMQSRQKKWTHTKTADALNKSRSAITRELEIAEIVERMPKLADAPNIEQAVRTIKKMQEHALVNEMKDTHLSRRDGEDKEIFGSAATENDKPKEKGKNKKEQREEDKISSMLRQANEAYMIGDAREGMREFIKDNDTSKYVGLIEVDPPYAIDLKGAKRTVDKSHANLNKYNEIEAKDYPAFLEEVAHLTYKSARDDAWLIFWYGHQWYYDVYSALKGAGWEVDVIPAVWTKTSGQTKQPEVNLARGYEPFLIGRKGSPVLRERGRLNVFHSPALPTSLKYHPTQRPLGLMLNILRTFVFPGDIVMSPFLGSGMTLIASYMSGLGCFGWDLTETYKDSFLLHLQRHLKATDEEVPTYEQAAAEEEQRDSEPDEDEVPEIETDDLEEELETILRETDGEGLS